MARTTDELLEQLARLLPEFYDTAEPLLAGVAAGQEAAEAVAPDLRARTYFQSATGKWLTLHASGYGVIRASGETDGALRKRLRQVEDCATVEAIKAAVDAIIAPDECQIVEWWDLPYLDFEGGTGLWLDNQSSMLSGGWHSFLVLIPMQSTGFSFGDHLDVDYWLNVSYLGEATEDPAYASIINEVERLRAAGVFWRLVLET